MKIRAKFLRRCAFPVALLVSLSVAASSAATVQAVADYYSYRDGLEPGWEDWSWGKESGFDLCSTNEVYAGTCAAAVDLESEGGFSLHHGDFGIGPWESLSFWAHGGSSGGQVLDVFLHGGGQNPSELTKVRIDPLSPAVWTQFTVPLADMGAVDTRISRMSIQAVGAPSLFYVDEMKLLASTEPPRSFAITVDAGNVQGRVPAEIFGTNAAAWWSGNLHKNDDVIDKVAASGVTVIRFPGGSAADEYRWKEHEPAKGGSNSPTDTNTTEFIQFARAVGAEPMITVNFGSGTAQEAADWVRFTNIQNDWNVKYWEVGNEIYGGKEGPDCPANAWEKSWTCDPLEYIEGDATHDGFEDFCQAMKAVDATIEVGVVGTELPDQFDGWGPQVLEAVSDCADFYVIHHYPFGPNTPDYVGLLTEPELAWPAIGESVRQMIGERNLDVAVTEYNSYWDEPDALAVQTVNMLFLADTLGQMMNQGFSYANHWDIVNGVFPHPNNKRYGFLLEDRDDDRQPNYYRQPSYYAYALWSQAGNQRISSSIDLDPGIEMAVYASRHETTGDVTLLAINKGEARNGTIALDNLQANGPVKAYVAQGKDGLADTSVAYNGYENPPDDLSTVAPVVTCISETFEYTFHAYSVTSLTIGSPPTFEDVPPTHWAYRHIEALYNSCITAGCSTDPPMYCPDSDVTRAQMAVFLLRVIHGDRYTPPDVGTSTGFGDVPPTHWAAAWIKQLAAEGITSGCGSGNYCPESKVTRAQMAVFLLRAKYSAAYAPPAVNGTMFRDVPASHWAADWIEQLATEGITTGCGSGNYCPASAVTRAQMAVFLVRTFNLSLP